MTVLMKAGMQHPVASRGSEAIPINYLYKVCHQSQVFTYFQYYFAVLTLLTKTCSNSSNSSAYRLPPPPPPDDGLEVEVAALT